MSYRGGSGVGASSRSGYTQDSRTYGYSSYEGGGGGGETLDYSDRTPYTVDSQGYSYSQSGGGYDLNESARTGYTETLDDSDRTPYSQGGYSQGGGYASQQADNSDMYSVNSRFSAVSGSQQYTSAASTQYYDQSSYCAASTGATTVADGGRGRCPYQIEFKVINQGKQISASKRTLHYRFGFANAAAMAQGRTGIDCRGEEHDIVVLWSITGGKRSISFDGREIQYSAGKRANASRRADILEAAWRMGDNVYEMKCYAYKPAAGSPEKRNPRWQQYSLIIDGRSFCDLPQVFDLGK